MAIIPSTLIFKIPSHVAASFVQTHSIGLRTLKYGSINLFQFFSTLLSERCTIGTDFDKMQNKESKNQQIRVQPQFQTWIFNQHDRIYILMQYQKKRSRRVQVPKQTTKQNTAKQL